MGSRILIQNIPLSKGGVMAINLSEKDQQMLDGKHGEAARLALSIILRMAKVLEASELMDITQAHIDGCGLMSEASLDFAESMAKLGGKVSVPTTLNMIPLDLRNWRDQGVPEEFAHKAMRMAQAYLDMGCMPTWTCAPYQGYLTPRFGQQIAWGESNAIAYANSVLGARTNRYADFFDLCAAITGRVPKQGFHLKENRKGQILFRLVDIPERVFLQDIFYAVLGHYIGAIAQQRVPVVEGLHAAVSSDQFKAFGAAAASAGAVGLYHIVGSTPEATTLEEAFQGSAPEQIIDVHLAYLQAALEDLSTSPESGQKLEAVILGCPHFSYDEFNQMARWIEAEQACLHPGVRLIVLTSRMSYSLIEGSHILETIIRFGAQIVFDTCAFHSPIVSSGAKVIMTNSGKCAYYGPGELNAEIFFASLEDCLRSAKAGVVLRGEGLRP
jgi:predicted aconitase